MFSSDSGDVGLAASDGGLLSGAPPDCDPGLVERRFGIVGCRAEGALLRSVMRTGTWMNDSSGREQVGALGVLLDHVLGEIFYTTRARDQWSLTTELAFDVIAPPPWNTTVLYAVSWVPRGERTQGFAQAEVTDDSGTLLAVGTTRIQYVAASASPPEAGHVGEIASRAANFAEHLGIRISSDTETTRVELPDTQDWGNLYGVLHGGIWAGMAETAAAEAFARRGGLRTAHVHVSYLRQSSPGASIRVDARPVHCGRLFGLMEVIGADDTGRQCVKAMVTGRRYEP